MIVLDHPENGAPGPAGPTQPRRERPAEWTKNGSALTGKTTTNLALSNLATADSGNYAVVIANAYGAITSSIMALTVQTSPPLIVTPPQPAQRYVGGTVTFTIVPGGSVPMSYQWNFNGTPIPGATSATYTIARVTATDVGNYSVKLTNAHGTLTSSNAALTLQPLAAGYAAELAWKAPIQRTHSMAPLRRWTRRCRWTSIMLPLPSRRGSRSTSRRRV